MSKLSSTNETLSCRQHAASARCDATAPSFRRARWNPQQNDGNSGHVPSRKRPRCHAFQKSHSPCTKRPDSKPTFPGSGMTQPIERLLNNRCRFTASSRFQASNAMAYLVSVSCEPAGGSYPSASYRFFCARKSAT